MRSASLEPLPCRGLVLPELQQAPRVERIAVAPPGPGEIRVRMRAAGLCHTDVSAIRDARFTPVVLGHEGAGIVESVGPGVADIRPGTPVLLCWKTPCGRCRRCSRGELHLCEDVLGLAEPRTFWRGQPIGGLLNTGCFAEFVVVPARAVVPLDADMPLDLAALIGCAVATGIGAVLRTARVEPGSTVAVWGAGGVGLNVVAGARLAHASTVVAVDPMAERRQLALRWGATYAVEPGEASACIREATGGRGVDYAFEVVGEPAIMEQALASLAPGGTLVLIGAAARDATFTFHPRAFMSKQQRIVGCIYGSLRPHADLPLLVRWCREGKLALADLVGRRVNLEELPTCFSDPAPPGVRTVVVFP